MKPPIQVQYSDYPRPVKALEGLPLWNGSPLKVLVDTIQI